MSGHYLFLLEGLDFISLEREASCYRRLRAEERHRADSISALQRRRQFIVARSLLAAICEYFALPYLGVKEDEQTGKPRALNIHFNISHSGNVLGLIVCTSPGELGLDIECWKKRDFVALSEQCFADVLSRQIKNTQVFTQQQKIFYEQWTLKEAEAKCSGLGFSAVLKKQGFAEQPNAVESCFLVGSRGDYSLALAAEQKISLQVLKVKPTSENIIQGGKEDLWQFTPRDFPLRPFKKLKAASEN